MRSILLSLIILLVYSFSVVGQASPCAERDYKCRLAAGMKAIQEDPKEPENYYEVARVMQMNGSHKEAIEVYSMYVAIPGVKPADLADGYSNRGISHRYLKAYDKALADQSKAIELDPHNPRFYVNRANVQANLNKPAAALEDYDRAVKANPKYAEAYAQRGILLVNLKRMDEGLRDFSRSIELDPTYAEPYYNRGTVYYQTGKCGLAIPDFDRYIPLVADRPAYQADGLLNRGICNASVGSPDKAIEDFSRVIVLQPTNVNAYKARAAMYRVLERKELAEADEKKARSLSKP